MTHLSLALRPTALLLSIAILLSFGCSNTTAVAGAEVPKPAAADATDNATMDALWKQLNDPKTQRVAPFKIFDNLYYVGIDWVAAYLLLTDAGLVLIDSLYDPWTDEMIRNIESLGFDPNDLAYVIVTHGHLDHAGGAAKLQSRFGAKVVMTAEDWALIAEPAADPRLATPQPIQDIVAQDGDQITLGDTVITLIETPGHTRGVLSLLYRVQDGVNAYDAITLGGVGRNFSGVAQTEAYIASYERLLRDTQNVSVSLPNHAAMANVFERAAQLEQRAAGALHPFVDAHAYQESLTTFLAAGKEKLVAERQGSAKSAVEELSDSFSSNRP